MRDSPLHVIAREDMEQFICSPRAATAAELKAHIEAERAGLPFLVYRDATAEQAIVVLPESADSVSVGRSELADVDLSWDDEVSRTHAELTRLGEQWTLVDGGLSLNGSFVNGELVRGRRRLHDGDMLRLGDTVLLFRDPREADARTTAPKREAGPAVSLSESQRRVLVALCRPFKDSTALVTPATNEQIAAELSLSVDAVKKHMRALFEKFGLVQLPRYEKRARLVERAFAGGFVCEQEL